MTDPTIDYPVDKLMIGMNFAEQLKIASVTNINGKWQVRFESILVTDEQLKQIIEYTLREGRDSAKG